mmetsp:Transcript_39979/g.93972  ORF Transcript_39979/g.93972 Transcript_39979/m.93972 type:complete len:289 (+) Transcript_39979:749-1615(+)
MWLTHASTCMQARRTGWTAHWSWWAERLCASSGLQSEGSSGFLHSSSSSSACCTPSLSHPAAGCCAWCATIEGASCCAPPCPPPPPSARALDADVGESAGESASTRGEGGREERRAEDAAGAREGSVVEREEEEREGERARAAGRAQRMRSSSVSFSPSGCFTPARSAHALACTRARSASLSRSLRATDSCCLASKKHIRSMSTVTPESLERATSAPSSTRRLVVLMRWFRTARCSGVSPTWSTQFTSTPHEARVVTLKLSPCPAAKCIGESGRRSECSIGSSSVGQS